MGRRGEVGITNGLGADAAPLSIQCIQDCVESDSLSAC